MRLDHMSNVSLNSSVQNGCVLWGSWVVVPSQGRQHVLEILHEGHLGVSQMKSLARGIVWWTNWDADQETLVRSCKASQVFIEGSVTPLGEASRALCSGAC